MHQVHDRVFVGAESDCIAASPNLAVVHACKSPCHQHAVGYRGKLPNTHPHYLVLERGHDLYLNIIDPPVPLFKPELFDSFLAFARHSWSAGGRLLIHCNQGESRAPTLALLFLAKHCRVIRDESFEAAAADFAPRYPTYNPGLGIRSYLTQHWLEIA